MNKPDARLLNPTTQNYLRQQAIRLREQGKRIVDIAQYLGVHRNTVSDWWQQYQQEGEAALFAATARQQTGRRSDVESKRRDASATTDAGAFSLRNWKSTALCGLVKPFAV